jgi:SAM-dependent methyltransferase
MNFNKSYYDQIWGTVHRHDFAESLADRLILQYNPKSVLDIGTGCGELVRVLREKGVEAYGLEISEYAVANSHGNVILGSVTDIPFKDGQFDLVYSQGLWEYVAEADIDRAWAECLRVGRKQEHNIDTLTDQAEWSKDFATHKSAEWWDEKLKQPRILVACPTADVKEYSMQRWIDNVAQLTYPNIEVLMVDNSPSEDFIKRWQDKVPMQRIDVTGIEERSITRINRSMEHIRQYFLKGDYTHWMDIESDVIPEPQVIEKLLKLKVDWASHAYPARGTTDGSVQQGIGCSLLSRRLIENFDWKDAEDHTTPDGWLWDRVRPRVFEFPTHEMYGVIKVEHLDG